MTTKRKTIGSRKPRARKNLYSRGTVVRMVNPHSLRGMAATVIRKEGLLLRVQLVGNQNVSSRVVLVHPSDITPF